MRLLSASHRLSLALLMLLAALTLAAGLGLRDPSPPDEPRFVLAARHMVETGAWLIPQRGSELYAHKPPPFMWMQAAAFLLVRDWQVAFLLPSLLAALATLWLTVDLARRLWNPRIGLLAGLALLTCVQFGLQAKRGQIDMVLVALTTLALWGLLRHLLRGPDWKALWLAGFAAGVGTVTKGVGFLPLLALVPWLLCVWRGRLAPAAAPGDAWRWLGLPAAFLAGTALWLLPLLVTWLGSDDPRLSAYVSEILFKQTAHRYVAAWHHLRPAWYYLQVVATLWLPGALLLPWLLPAWWRRLRRGDPRFLLLLGWVALVMLFFSISPGKREVYVFPALPAACIAAAPLLTALLRRVGVRIALLAFVSVLGLIALGAGAVGTFGSSDVFARLAVRRDLADRDLHALLRWLLALGAFALVVAAACRLRRAGSAVVVFTSALWIAYGIGLAPALDASSSGRQLMENVGRRLGRDDELALVAWREQLLLQADRPTVDFGFSRPPSAQWTDAYDWLTRRPARRWVLVDEEALPPCIAREHAVSAGRSNRGHWLLVPGDAISAECDRTAHPERSASN